MATLTNTTQDIKAYIIIRIKNNMKGVIDTFNQNGYPIPVNASEQQVYSVLWSLYKENPTEFFKVIRLVPFNTRASNFTTSQRVIQVLREYHVAQNPAAAGQRSDAEEIAQGAADFLGGSKQTDSTTTTTKTAAENGLLWGGIAVIIIMAVLVVYQLKKG